MRPAAAIVATLLFAGCGGEDPQAALRETTANLGQIRSGELALSVRLEGRGAGARVPIGFELRGPFALAKEGGLPVARVRYTQIAGSERATATFISTGSEAFVEVGEQAYELGEKQLGTLTARAGSDPLGGLDLQSWVRDPEDAGSEERDGVETDHVRAGLDAVAALRDLAGVTGGAGAGLEGDAAKRLQDAVRDAQVDIWTGADDRLLRRLELRASVDLDVPQQVRSALGDLVGGDVRLALELRRVNEPVEVEPPTDAKPASELPRG